MLPWTVLSAAVKFLTHHASDVIFMTCTLISQSPIRVKQSRINCAIFTAYIAAQTMLGDERLCARGTNARDA